LLDAARNASQIVGAALANGAEVHVIDIVACRREVTPLS